MGKAHLNHIQPCSSCCVPKAQRKRGIHGIQQWFVLEGTSGVIPAVRNSCLRYHSWERKINFFSSCCGNGEWEKDNGLISLISFSSVSSSCQTLLPPPFGLPASALLLSSKDRAASLNINVLQLLQGQYAPLTACFNFQDAERTMCCVQPSGTPPWCIPSTKAPAQPAGNAKLQHTQQKMCLLLLPGKEILQVPLLQLNNGPAWFLSVSQLPGLQHRCGTWAGTAGVQVMVFGR